MLQTNAMIHGQYIRLTKLMRWKSRTQINIIHSLKVKCWDKMSQFSIESLISCLEVIWLCDLIECVHAVASQSQSGLLLKSGMAFSKH